MVAFTPKALEKLNTSLHTVHGKHNRHLGPFYMMAVVTADYYSPGIEEPCLRGITASSSVSSEWREGSNACWMQYVAEFLWPPPRHEEWVAAVFTLHIGMQRQVTGVKKPVQHLPPMWKGTLSKSLSLLSAITVCIKHWPQFTTAMLGGQEIKDTNSICQAWQLHNCHYYKLLIICFTQW